MLVHEIQHVIQSIENFAKGGNVQSIRQQLSYEQYLNFEAIREQIKKIESEENQKLVQKYLGALQDWRLLGSDKEGYYADKVKRVGNLVKRELGNDWKKRIDEFSKTNARLKMLEEDKTFSDRNLYSYLGGETEANHVMYRAARHPKGMPRPHIGQVIIVFGNEEFPAEFSFGNENSARDTNKNIVKISGKEFGEYTDIKELRKKAISYYRENLQGTSVFNAEFGRVDIDENGIINFTSDGGKKLISTSPETQKLLLIKYLPELIRTATNVRGVDTHKERHKDDYFDYMNNTVEINGQRRPVHITLIKRNNGNINFQNIN